MASSRLISCLNIESEVWFSECVNMCLTTLDSLGMFPPTVSTPYIPATPMMPSGAAFTAMSSGPEVIFSGKHNGISIYFTRILGSVSDTLNTDVSDYMNTCS